jgi:uncharacterized protein YecE (DUF72 family)
MPIPKLSFYRVLARATDDDTAIGTSGWSYPAGRGTWNGIFYPEKGAAPKGFDELAFYAERFNTVEVNSTFYGHPEPTSASRGSSGRLPVSSSR